MNRPILNRAGMLAGALGLCLLAAGPALADGGGNSDSDTPTCGKGQVWNSSKQQCVKAENGVVPDKALTDYADSMPAKNTKSASVVPDKALTDYADALLKAHRYREALGVLGLMKNPNTAVALNYRGYATRKLGRIDEGIGYYLRSVALDPHYPQVREYLGEAYLLKGDTRDAETQLAAIKAICGTTCEAYEHLEVAIADPHDI